jgi:predicted permease
MLAFFGNRGAGPLAMAILAEVMVLLSVGGILMSSSVSRGGIVRLILRGTALNPIVAAIVIGATVTATGWTLPDPLSRFLAFLGGAAGPAALFALGGALAVHDLDRATILATSWITAAKLALYPLTVWLVLDRLLSLDAILVQAGVLIAALPSAGNVYVMAKRYDADPGSVSAAIALSTVVSVLSVPFTAWLVLT